MTPSAGVSDLTRVEAIFSNPALYELAGTIPKKRNGSSGRRRLYPEYMWLAFEALVSVYESARQVEAELAHPLVWRLIRDIVQDRFRDQPEMHLPPQPMRRHHYRYARDRYLADPSVLRVLSEVHRRLAASEARELGLLDASGPGSWTHPDRSRILYADGKVITPLYRARRGDTKLDAETGEVRELRYERDADLHFEGDGKIAYGTKFVLVAVRTEDERGRIILDVEWVPKPGAEARVAMNCFGRLRPFVEGAQAVVYDTALRGVHHQVLLRELGLMPINRVTAAEAGAKQPRRGKGRRVEKSTHVETKTVRLVDGSTVTLHLYARGGAIGIVEIASGGEPIFSELRRVRTHRTRDKGGRYRWYNDYELPPSYGAGTVTVRLHANPQDALRRFNRTENVRPIAPSDADFKRLYSRRNDAESINRDVVDSMYIGRAHSVGHRRQQVNLLGYALMVNSLALHLCGRSRAGPPARAA